MGDSAKGNLPQERIIKSDNLAGTLQEGRCETKESADARGAVGT